jgi:transglutaminase-like putative cysteine protease
VISLRDRAFQSPLVDAGAQAVLIAGAMAAVAWAVVSGNWAPTAGPRIGVLVWVVLGGVIEGFLVARLTTARPLALISSPILLYLVLIPLTRGLMMGADGLSFPEIIGRYANASIFGLTSTDDWTFIVGLGSVLWLIGYYMTFMAIGMRRSALGALPPFGALGINALNAPAPAAVFRPSLIAAMFLLLAISGGEFRNLTRRWRLRGMPATPNLGLRFALQAAIAVGALLCVAATIPPLTSRDLSRSLFHNGPFSQQGDGSQVVAFSSEVDPGGALVSKPQRVLTYTTDTPGGYFRVEDDGYFQAGVWLPGAPSGVMNGINAAAGPIPRDTNPADGGLGSPTSPTRVDITYVQTNATGPSPLGIFPGEAISSTLPVQAIGVGGSQGLLTVDKVALTGGISVGSTATFGGVQPGATVDQLRAAGTSYPAFVQAFAHWDTGSADAATIASLARKWTAGTSNPYDKAQAIESHLRDPHSFSYTLTPSVPPAGQWSIVYFLTTSHSGYCQYFASSMGAMLRSLGIPTRLVTGFGPGAALQSQKPNETRYAVTTSDAHVWVEAYFPGAGWLPFEPTPPSVLGNYQPFQRGAVTPKPQASAAAPTPTAVAQATPTPVPTPNRATTPPNAGGSSSKGFSIPGWIPRLLLLLAVLAGIGFAGVTWMKKAATTADIWRRLNVVARFTGVRARRVSDTEQSYMEHWINRMPGEPAPERVAHYDEMARHLRGIASLSSKDRFSNAGLDDTERLQMVEGWQGVLRLAPRIVLYRWRQP